MDANFFLLVEKLDFYLSIGRTVGVIVRKKERKRGKKKRKKWSKPMSCVPCSIALPRRNVTFSTLVNRGDGSVYRAAAARLHLHFRPQIYTDRW